MLENNNNFMEKEVYLMDNIFGTVTRGLKAPIIREGDDICKIVVDTVLNASKEGNLNFNNKDIVAITEAIVARGQGNYATIEQIAKSVESIFGRKTVGVVFPILSRNRFSVLLKGIAKGCSKIVLMLSYPSDEVGNHLISFDDLDEKGINPWIDLLTEEKYRELFGENKHYFTGVDYVEFYKEIIKEQGADVEIILVNDVKRILEYTKNIICCDIHTKERSKRILRENGADKVVGLDNILMSSIDGSGYNEDYGLLGSNMATGTKIKLFPRNSQELVEKIQKSLIGKTGKNIEVMVYGDGAFKDPAGKIWELADPVVSPGFTSGLIGTPNEVKLKYLADNDFAHLSGQELKDAISQYITKKDENNKTLVGEMVSQGTTPRQLTDLIGSLCDLTSGSGDKGTPIVLVQGYFNNFTK